jgi:hypothetical protein
MVDEIGSADAAAVDSPPVDEATEVP